MSKLEPRDRAAIVKRVKELSAQIQNPRLSIARIESLQRERHVLHARLMEDRVAR